MARQIGLTRGAHTIVDDRDYEYLSQKKWFLHSGGYAVRNINTGTRKKAGIMYMHRVILGVLPGFEVDHINGNKLDNRRSNLRICTTSLNQANRKMKASSQHRYKGIQYDADRKKWRARIIVNGRDIHLGRFETDEQAARAYDEAARRYFGEFARTNF